MKFVLQLNKHEKKITEIGIKTGGTCPRGLINQPFLPSHYTIFLILQHFIQTKFFFKVKYTTILVLLYYHKIVTKSLITKPTKELLREFLMFSHCKGFLHIIRTRKIIIFLVLMRKRI